MELRQLAYNTVKNNEEFCKKHNISPKHLETIYKVYYNSLVKEIYNTEKTKFYIYQNELGVFRNNLSGYINFLREWKIRLRKGNLNKKEDPLKIIEIYLTKVYPVILKEVNLYITYIKDVKYYLDSDRMTYEEVIEFNQKFVWVKALIGKIKKLLEQIKIIANKREKYYKELKQEV